MAIHEELLIVLQALFVKFLNFYHYYLLPRTENHLVWLPLNIIWNENAWSRL